MNKKICFIILVVIFTSCIVGLSLVSRKSNNRNETQKTKEYKEKENKYDNYLYIVLKINMPLNFDDLDNIFEFPMTDYLEEKEIGEIIGDGSPLDTYGPYATDIEFEIKENKLEDFKKMLQTYTFPIGSYLEIEGKKDENTKEFGELYGTRLVCNNLLEEEIEKIYTNLSNEIKENYIYKTIYQRKNDTIIYYYGKNRKQLNEKINKYINENIYIKKIKIMNMPLTINEL